MLKLKEYQKRTLDKLTEFLEQAKLKGIQQAFIQEQEAVGYSKKYKELTQLEDIPYVCLRLPTGGGKTLLSSHAVSVVANSFLEQEFPSVLWLVPTDIIRKQTIEVLKNALHPNREVLDSQFDGRVRVFDISDFNQMRPQDMGESVNIFVATFAAFRVTSTDGRRVYAHNEDLEPHFVRIPKSEYLELSESGDVKFSFANVLAHMRPIVIIDEAHNHKSKLSVEVLQRLRPSAIVEFTATPDDNSNVLYKVSASELKTEDMIKLPVRLAEHRSWEDAVTSAIQTRERLEEIAAHEDSYIRPIVLFQAENIDRDVTVNIILKYLLEQEEIPRDQIAVATGSEKGLDGINLFDPKCEIRYVITVQALKEGWDCSFAYVFCSIAKVQSSKDAEQLLGRVLRMPYAKRRKSDELNRAYAHVSVSTWAEAIGRIRDNLIGMGFEDVEAEANIQCVMPEVSELTTSPEQEDVVVFVDKMPNVEVLTMGLRDDITVETQENGSYKVTIKTSSRNELNELVDKVADIFPDKKNQSSLIEAVAVKKTFTRLLSPSEKGETFEVPQLCLDFGDGEAGVADRESFLPDGWNILEYSPILENFQVNEENHIYEIDLKGTKLTERAISSQEKMDLGTATHWTQAQLVNWLDQKVRQSDIPYNSLVEYIRRTVQHLEEKKGVLLPDLVRLRYVLEKLIREKIAEHRVSAYESGIQTILFEKPEVAMVSPSTSISFREGCYPAKTFYRGRFQFQKHFFPGIGDMNGEEEACAKALDGHSKVKTWVRNIEQHPNHSFWLPTSTDKFYPDFVAKLTDDRILAVEYKGEHLVTNQDTKEKDLVGQLWSRSSNSSCLFLMATKRDELGRDVYQQIDAIINGSEMTS